MTCLCDHHFERTRSVVQRRGGRETEFANKNLKKTYRTALLPNDLAHTIITTILYRRTVWWQWVNGPPTRGPAIYIGTRSRLAAVCAARRSPRSRLCIPTFHRLQSAVPAKLNRTRIRKWSTALTMVFGWTWNEKEKKNAPEDRSATHNFHNYYVTK